MKIIYDPQQEVYCINIEHPETLTMYNTTDIVELREMFIQYLTEWFNRAICEQLKSQPERGQRVNINPVDVCCEATDIINNAPTVNPYEWISVEDKLPEKFTNVLCLYPSKNYGSNIAVDYMESDRGYFAEQFRYGEPTHWMPLPTPPTEKEN